MKQIAFFEDVKADPPVLPAGPAPTYVAPLHGEAMRLPRPGFERALVSILRGLAEYAQAARNISHGTISDDGYLGSEWALIVSGARSLLNGEAGRLDCGEMDRQFEALLRSRGGDAEVAAVMAATDQPKAPPRSAKVEAVQIGAKRLTDRQRDLLNLVQVNDQNVAIYTGQEHIPDWAALKSVMTALGGKWQAKSGFRFHEDLDARELVRLALETGEILDAKEAEFFETSAELADQLVQWVAPCPTWRILEPSAGKGAIVRAVKRHCSHALVYCFEPFAAHIPTLEGITPFIRQEDFAAAQMTGPLFDGVVMNPPFSKRQDIRHIIKAVSWLRPGGRLAAIASAGVLYRQDAETVAFRELVDSVGGSIDQNPEGSFLHAGTGVSTVMIRMRRNDLDGAFMAHVDRVTKQAFAGECAEFGK